MHEDLGRIGAVDNRAIGQRDIADKAQQILQEHRVDAHDTVDVLAVLRFPQGCDTLRVAGPIGRIGIARVVQVTVVAEQRLILFVDALDCLILAESNAGNKLADRHLAIGNRNQTLRAAKAAAGTNLNIVHGVHKVVTRLAVGAEHLGKDGGDLLRRVNRAVEGSKAVLGLIDQLGHLGNMSIANTLDLLVCALEHLGAIGKRIGNGLQRGHVNHAVLEQLAGRGLRKVVGHGNQRVARDIGQGINHGAGCVDVTAIHRDKRSRRPQRARGLRLHAVAELINLLCVVRQRRKIARRDLVLKATDDLDSLLRFALYGLCRVKQHKAACAKHNEKHRDYSGNNGASMTFFALALAMAMTDQAVRGRTRRSVATVVQAKIVIIFLGTRARKLGTAIIQAGERASLGSAGVNRAKVTRKPRATGRGSIVGGLAGINVAGGIRGVGSTCVVRGYRRSPTRLRRGGCTARKDIPSCTAGLFCLL